MTLDFAHLHVASGFSMRYGASMPEDLVERAAHHGQHTLALTDRDGLYGAVRFATAAARSGIAPVLGVDLACADSVPADQTRAHPTRADQTHVDQIQADQTHADSPHPWSGPMSRQRTPVRGGSYVDARLPRVTVLGRGVVSGVPHAAGWRALCRVVSEAHADALSRGDRGRPVTSRERIRSWGQEADALVVLLGADSDVGRAVLARRDREAHDRLVRWRRSLPGAVVVEVVCHDGPPGTPGCREHARRMLALADATGTPAILSAAVRHRDRDQARVVDVLDASRRLVVLDRRHLDRTTDAAHLASTETMARLAEVVAVSPVRAAQLLHDTVALGAECTLDIRRDLGIGSVHLPEASVLGIPAGTDPQAVLQARCRGAVAERYPGADETLWARVQHRLAEELDVIARLGYATYFLTVAEVTDLIRDRGVRVAARGSGAGSLVNYLLRISGVDPIRYDLLMERFCSPLRAELPDIDIDVESARRTEIYEAVIERFGASRVTCVSMMDTYRVRHAIRDVGAALGMAPRDVDEIATSFPHIRARDARAAIADLPELRSRGFGAAHLQTFFDLVESLDGLPRHIALHPCGIVLSGAGLLDRTPVEPSLLGFPMSQFDKDDVEALGLLKLDVLGIRMQSAMAHAVGEIERTTGERIDLDDQAQVPFDDEETFAMIRTTRTLGCFQIESPGQRELIGKLGPTRFEDLIVDISLFRPGPVKSDMITPYLESRHGWRPVRYLHPSLVPALEETEGVVVFHEQVLHIVAVTTGVSLAQADEVRRAMGTPAGQVEIEAWWRPAAAARGYTSEEIDRIWEVLRSFASFGFCKAHAAAFALPTYHSAWLKTHHPAAFLAGVLTHDPGMYPKRLILDDARTIGIEILPVDVNASGADYVVEPVRGEDGDRVHRPGIRLSLTDVKGISAAEVARIAEAAPFLDLDDFWHRAGVSRPVVERLVTVGAFDRLHGIGAGGVGRRGQVTRRDLLLHVAALDRHSRSRGSGERTQLSLDLGDAPRLVAHGLPELTGVERVQAELEILGLDASAHVMDFYRPLTRAIGVTRAADLLSCRSGSVVWLAGTKVATQTPPIRSGRRVVFLTIDDGTGPADTTFFEDVQGPYAEVVFHSWMLLVRGVVRRTGDRGVSVRATGAWELSVLEEAWRDGGMPAVERRIAETDLMAALEADENIRGGHRRGRRVLVHASGFRQSPYADIAPAGTSRSRWPASDGDTGRWTAPAGPTRKIWHASPGSSGR
ncbi:DNA polymerase III subunit alpha [Nostocoides sp. F2B08]|uniref:DNA polymerase III subunit alpha n=1 Tax=Nostocoides sp. F2B08 TaxID=2653936 RepID=UPI0012638C50|nr:DNA polymerase III subunit alpha [Tetrasphaera sp. F2B08]KAB7742438.1 DNA polymerase III subunit alpha [Tetrasphaera sp. F2B08]